MVDESAAKPLRLRRGRKIWRRFGEDFQSWEVREEIGSVVEAECSSKEGFEALLAGRGVSTLDTLDTLDFEAMRGCCV